MSFIKTYLGVFIRGAGMGAADLIPGVSGGTVAFITGIYERLLAAVGELSSPALIHKLRHWQIGALWRQADGGFLAALFAGILSAILLLGRVLHYLLNVHAHLLLAFFAGLVAASAVLMIRQLRARRRLHLLIALAGAVPALIAVSLPAVSLTPSLPVLFIGGAVAVCAMILPGISGSYILLIAGLYTPIIEALQLRQWAVLLVVAAGCGVGLLAFARLLSFLLRRMHDGMTAFLIGVMLGALPKLWPWKQHATGAKIITRPNVWPMDFAGDAQVAAVLMLAFGGGLLVWAVHFASNRRPPSPS